MKLVMARTLDMVELLGRRLGKARMFGKREEQGQAVDEDGKTARPAGDNLRRVSIRTGHAISFGGWIVDSVTATAMQYGHRERGAP
ncbi:MAG TPA: hypothetical protein VF801_05475 [Rhodocyclaceae bacterium]